MYARGDSHNTPIITITHSQFTNNSALGNYGRSGVVYAWGDVNIGITNSRFINNSALGGGGVVQIYIHIYTREVLNSISKTLVSIRGSLISSQ